MSRENRVIPIHPDGLVRVKADNGLEYTHIRIDPELIPFVRSCAERWPNIGWARCLLERPTHGYPDKHEEKEQAIEIGELYLQIAELMADENGVAQDLLFISMGITLSGGHVLGEDMIAARRIMDGEEPEKSNRFHIPSDPVINSDERPQIFQFVLRKTVTDAKTGNSVILESYPEDKGQGFHLLEHFGKKTLSGYHRVPQTPQERRRDILLTDIYCSIMNALPFHDARNFALASAGRLTECGVLSLQNLHLIDQAYSSALEASRGARLHTEPGVDGEDEGDPYVVALRKQQQERVDKAKQAGRIRRSPLPHVSPSTKVKEEEPLKKKKRRLGPDRTLEEESLFKAEPVNEFKVIAFLEPFRGPILSVLSELDLNRFSVSDQKSEWFYRGDVGQTEEAYANTCALVMKTPTYRGLIDYRRDIFEVYGLGWDISLWTTEDFGTLRMYPKVNEQTHFAGIEFTGGNAWYLEKTLAEISAEEAKDPNVLDQVRAKVAEQFTEWVAEYEERQRRYFYNPKRFQS